MGDLTNPPNWYPEARALNRKIIFHAGPTNSGKTYHALERCKNVDEITYAMHFTLSCTQFVMKGCVIFATVNNIILCESVYEDS